MTVPVSKKVSPDGEYMRAALLHWLPECSPLVEELEAAEVESARDLGLVPQEIGIYSLLSEAFVWPVLVPALERQLPGDPVVVRCAHLLEELVTSPSSEVRQAVKIRVIEILAGSGLPMEEIKKNIGPVTAGLVAASRN
ncbi:hypothetical protein ACIQCJ_24780 [Streptomyces sp. NPDC093221]|uniref:hypothetical protein n=1 Tax=Streptomyces sp. NPDC093221 TaxID=3366032 RepID=UPI00381BE91F